MKVSSVSAAMKRAMPVEPRSFDDLLLAGDHLSRVLSPLIVEGESRNLLIPGSITPTSGDHAPEVAVRARPAGSRHRAKDRWQIARKPEEFGEKGD